MTKRRTIFVSILLIISALVIQVLIKDRITAFDNEIVEFFSGIIFGVGISFLVISVFRKNK